MKSTTTDKIIASLKRMFLTHGEPISIVTDNGPQFSSDEFRKYIENDGIQHRTTITTVAAGRRRNRAPESFLAKAHQNYSHRKERLERGTKCLLDNIQDHTSQHYRCKPH